LVEGARALVDGEASSETAAAWLEPRFVVRAGTALRL